MEPSWIDAADLADYAERLVLVVMAHPDEVEYFVGGTVALLADAGADLSYVLVTSGDKGSDDPAMTPDNLAATREEEQRVAAARFGVRAVAFLREPDGEVLLSNALRRRVGAEIRRARPDLVIGPDPLGYLHQPTVNHPDLYPVGEAVLHAVSVGAAGRLHFADLLVEGLAPHRVSELWLAGSPAPDHWVDITGVIERKFEALAGMATQVRDKAKLRAQFEREFRAPGNGGSALYREGLRRLRFD